MDMKIVLDAMPAVLEIYVNFLVLTAKIIFAIKIRDPALMGALIATTKNQMVYAASVPVDVHSVPDQILALIVKM